MVLPACAFYKEALQLLLHLIIIFILLTIIIIIIEGLSLLQSIPPTTADKQTQAQKRRGHLFNNALI